MKGYIDNLEHLGYPVTLGLGVSLILIGLRKEFNGFVQNYNMCSLGKTINELHAMLKLHEQTLPKNNAPALHAIRAGHWKRNCTQYLAELLKKKKNTASGAGGSCIFVIELNTILNRSWIYDTGYGTHTCNTTQGLRTSRKLKSGALSLYVGNGQREAVEAIGVFYLCLSSVLEIVLNNCHYAPSITIGVIFVSRLYEDGFINRFMNNTIQVSRNNMVYFSVILRGGIFKIDLSNFYTNESSVYDVSNKRAKLDLDSALLWHCRLGHISKRRIEKLQHDGLLISTDLGDFEKCVSFMSGKMARKPYTHQVERAKDLLGLIHTDVCCPFKIMSRQGASYFVTFTEDFSRYPKEMMGYSFYYPPENKVLVAQNAEFLENSHITQEASGSPQGHESTRTRHAPDRMRLYISAEEHELGDLGEPANYKAALLDLESEKWLNAMNVEMQSMKDNKYWVLVELPPNGKIVGCKWLFKKKTDMDGVNSKRGSIPMQEKLKLSKAQGASTPAELKRMQNVPYASIVGSIMYAVRCTRPDVAFAQNVTSRFQQNPGDLKRELRVFCYTDAGYLTDADDLKSQTGYVFILNGGVVDWKSAKQSIFATSSAEAGYIAAFDASKEAVWVRKFIYGLGVVPTIEEPISMYCDNTGAIAIANELGITKGARHFRAKVHSFVKLLNMVT
nr:hypothetical protein [Tanacetum cinerariifolium]